MGPYSDPVTVNTALVTGPFSSPVTVNTAIGSSVWYGKTASGWVPLDIYSLP